MQSRGKLVGAIALCAAFLAYQLLIHKLTISGQLTPLTTALGLVPFVIAAGWAIALELGLRLALFITASLLALGFAAAMAWGLPQPAILFGLPHLASNFFLMWFFGRTLKAGREPLITSIARRVHGSLTPDIEIYTRRVTYIWSAFFALQVALSIGLYAFSSLEAWSMFINILNLPQVILLFVCEYIYRVLRYRDHHSSIFSGLQIFSRDSSAPDSTKGH